LTFLLAGAKDITMSKIKPIMGDGEQKLVSEISPHGNGLVLLGNLRCLIEVVVNRLLLVRLLLIGLLLVVLLLIILIVHVVRIHF